MDSLSNQLAPQFTGLGTRALIFAVFLFYNSILTVPFARLPKNQNLRDKTHTIFSSFFLSKFPGGGGSSSSLSDSDQPAWGHCGTWGDARSPFDRRRVLDLLIQLSCCSSWNSGWFNGDVWSGISEKFSPLAQFHWKKAFCFVTLSLSSTMKSNLRERKGRLAGR